MSQTDREIHDDARAAYEGAQGPADAAWAGRFISAHLREVTALGVWWPRRVELAQATTDREVAFVGAGLMEGGEPLDGLALARPVRLGLLAVVGEGEAPQGYQLTRAGEWTLELVRQGDGSQAPQPSLAQARATLRGIIF